MLSQTVVLDSSNLPIVIIDTKGKTIMNEPRTLVNIKVVDNGQNKMNYTKQSKFQFNNWANIEIRGRSSQAYPQKQYAFETKDSVTGDDLNVSIMGLPEEEDWVLYAPYNDISLVRNVMTYKLWENMGHWAPRTKYCELILNGQYQGIYILTEKIKRDKNRVDIANVKPEDSTGLELTGGYIMCVDRANNATDKTFISVLKSTNNQNVTWLYIEPDPQEINPKQADYIRKFIDTMELVISSPNFADPVNGYRNYISTQSFIDYILLTEFSRNADAYKASSYFYKEKLEEDGSKGLMKAGPVWDYNFAYGNASFCSGFLTTGWSWDGCVPATLPTPVLWRRLMQDPVFANEAKCRWSELRRTLLDTVNLFRLMDSYGYDTLLAARNRHFNQWKIIGTNPGGFNAYIASSYDDEIKRVKTWIKNRLSWMDANLPGVCTPTTAQFKVPLKAACELNSNVNISNDHPFSDPIFKYSGKEKLTSIPSNISSWVLVELRDEKDSSKLIDSRALLLRNDQTIVDTNFKNTVQFFNASPNTKYRICVRYNQYSYVFSSKAFTLPTNVSIDLTNALLRQLPDRESKIHFNQQSLLTNLSICQSDSLFISNSVIDQLGLSLTLDRIECKGAQISSRQDGFFISHSEVGEHPLVVYYLCAGNYWLKISSILKVIDKPELRILGPDIFCFGDTITLSLNETFEKINWSNGSTGKEIKVSETGKIRVEVHQNNCASVAEKDLIQFPRITGSIVSNTINQQCKVEYIPSGGTSPFDFTWSNGSKSNPTLLEVGAYSLIVRDSNQCSRVFSGDCKINTGVDNVHVLQFDLVPNPAYWSVNVVTQELLNKGQIILFDLNGRKLNSLSFDSNNALIFTLNLELLDPGIYFVEVRTVYGNTRKPLIVK
ncbi:MAG TPA: CotH kinase family protein [Saprospiraceae bacterium]|nr:CotH kinase family protein [Saprospiraceae bacterium]